MPEAATLEPKRVIVVLRPQEEATRKAKLRERLVWVAAAAVLLIGVAIGNRFASVIAPDTAATGVSAPVTSRVKGGLYALELATPHGQSRWILEFDAEVVTKDGPQNPQEMRNALEDLVITATSLPLVQGSSEPDIQMRKSMLAIAQQNYPWLVDLYLKRSELQNSSNRLGDIGRAMRNLYDK